MASVTTTNNIAPSTGTSQDLSELDQLDMPPVPEDFAKNAGSTSNIMDTKMAIDKLRAGFSDPNLEQQMDVAVSLGPSMSGDGPTAVDIELWRQYQQQRRSQETQPDQQSKDSKLTDEKRQQRDSKKSGIRFV